MDKPPIQWKGSGKVFQLAPDPIPLEAVGMTHDRYSGPGVLLPDGQLIIAHRGGIALYVSEADALARNPGATIHRHVDADMAINPTAAQ